MTTTAPSIALLAFFPLASTSTCTAECAFSEDSDRFASAGTESSLNEIGRAHV